MSGTRHTNTGIDQVSDRIAKTRDELEEAVGTLTGKAGDVKERVSDATRRAADKAETTTHEALDQVSEFIRERPGRWTTILTGALVAGAAVGILLWRRTRA